MMTKAGGHSVLFLAAGLLVGSVGLSLAAPTAQAPASLTSDSIATAAKKVQHSRPIKSAAQPKSATQLKSGKAAAKPALASKKPADVTSGNDDTAAIPPSVANANAQLSNTLSAKPGATASSEAAPATEPGVVAPDQLNDIDRMMQQSAPPAAPAAMVSPEPTAEAMADTNDPANGEHASLIGEIFIGIGVLLTVASAARMFMA